MHCICSRVTDNRIHKILLCSFLHDTTTGNYQLPNSLSGTFWHITPQTFACSASVHRYLISSEQLRRPFDFLSRNIVPPPRAFNRQVLLISNWPFRNFPFSFLSSAFNNEDSIIYCYPTCNIFIIFILFKTFFVNI